MVPWDPMGTGLGIIPCIPSHGPPVLLSILSRSPVGTYGMSLGIPCVPSHCPTVLLSILSHGPVGTHGMSLGIPCVPSHAPPVLLSILSHCPVGTYEMSLGIPCVPSHAPPQSSGPSGPIVLWVPLGCPWETQAFQHTHTR